MKDGENMMSEFADKVTINMGSLKELFKTYDLAELGYKMEQEREKDIYNRVLAENDFRASKEYNRLPGKTGERITDEEFMFLLSDEDFRKVLSLAGPLMEKAKISDNRGYYITNWLEITGDARRDLVDFILKNILPDGMKAAFNPARMNITHHNKLIGLIRPLVSKI